MAQLWGGRFTKETDKLVYNFNASISFDPSVTTMIFLVLGFLVLEFLVFM